jgi:hypothetical protein
MKKISTSVRIYAGLISVLVILGAISVFMPLPEYAPGQEYPASKGVIALVTACGMLIIYGGLGFIGLILSSKPGFAEIWDKKVTNRQRFVIPTLVGVFTGVIFILADMLFVRFHSLGPLPHPPFPLSIIASATAAIGEEVLFRLFFISFWVWLISYVLLKKRLQNIVFWIVVVFSALAFGIGHMPGVMALTGFHKFADLPVALLTEILLLNGLVSVFAAYYFRKYGFLTAVIIHFVTDLVWHIFYGLV